MDGWGGRRLGPPRSGGAEAPSARRDTIDFPPGLTLVARGATGGLRAVDWRPTVRTGRGEALTVVPRLAVRWRGWWLVAASAGPRHYAVLPWRDWSGPVRPLAASVADGLGFTPGTQGRPPLLLLDRAQAEGVRVRLVGGDPRSADDPALDLALGEDLAALPSRTADLARLLGFAAVPTEAWPSGGSVSPEPWPTAPAGFPYGPGAPARPEASLTWGLTEAGDLLPVPPGDGSDDDALIAAFTPRLAVRRDGRWLVAMAQDPDTYTLFPALDRPLQAVYLPMSVAGPLGVTLHPREAWAAGGVPRGEVEQVRVRLVPARAWMPPVTLPLPVGHDLGDLFAEPGRIRQALGDAGEQRRSWLAWRPAPRVQEPPAFGSDRVRLRQVVRPQLVRPMLDNLSTATISPTLVQGFVTRTRDSAHLTDPGALWRALRPDHPAADGSRPEPGDELWLLDAEIPGPFQARVIPSRADRVGVPADGGPPFLPPWTGTGRTAGEPSLDEFVAEASPLLAGATLTKVDGSGAEVRGILELDHLGRLRWRDAAGPPKRDTGRAPSVTPTTPWVFLDVDGWWPATPIDHGLVVVRAVDARALRLRLPGVRTVRSTRWGAWAVVPLADYRHRWQRTRRLLDGHSWVQHWAGPDSSATVELGLVRVGRPGYRDDASAPGGTQYTGLCHRAAAAVAGPPLLEVLPEAPEPEPGRIDPPSVAPDGTVRWHEQFLRLASGALVPVTRTQGRLWSGVPDATAADLMFPGHGGLRSTPGGLEADVTGLRGRETVAATLADRDGVPGRVTGERGKRLTWHPEGEPGREISISRVNLGPPRDVVS